MRGKTQKKIRRLAKEMFGQEPERAKWFLAADGTKYEVQGSHVRRLYDIYKKAKRGI